MNVSRRLFLKNGGVALASVGLAPVIGPAFLRRAVFAADTANGGKRRPKTLICIFQRGAADGLSMVVPTATRTCTGSAPNSAFRAPFPPATGVGRRSTWTAFSACHPALAPFLPIYKSATRPIVTPCGSPAATPLAL
jgi:uncharacterized protein (DUF1501 family)